jgi:hypothetical protein
MIRTSDRSAKFFLELLSSRGAALIKEKLQKSFGETPLIDQDIPAQWSTF